MSDLWKLFRCLYVYFSLLSNFMINCLFFCIRCTTHKNKAWKRVLKNIRMDNKLYLMPKIKFCSGDPSKHVLPLVSNVSWVSEALFALFVLYKKNVKCIQFGTFKHPITQTFKKKIGFCLPRIIYKKVWSAQSWAVRGAVDKAWRVDMSACIVCTVCVC